MTMRRQIACSNSGVRLRLPAGARRRSRSSSRNSSHCNSAAPTLDLANAASAWSTTGWRASRTRRARSWSPRRSTTNSRLSSKTTFDAVTHALMTTPLTDASGAKLAGWTTRWRSSSTWSRSGRGPRGVRRSPVPHLRPADRRRARHAGAVAGVQARRRQHRLSQGLPDQLSRAGRHAVDPDLDRA